MIDDITVIVAFINPPSNLNAGVNNNNNSVNTNPQIAAYFPESHNNLSVNQH